ncbi:MAG: 2TM domain-containing protein [Solirubrobacterales bacterium]
MNDGIATNPEELRNEAVKRLKKKRDFKAHLLSYVLINAMLVGIWAISGAGFFWPAFVLLGWGVGLAFNAYDVYGRHTITEDQVQREIENLKR